jgi:hypothetical protein
MTKLKLGDRVDCRVKSSVIVGPYKDYDEIRTFQIIAKDKQGYYLYVPAYYTLKNTLRVDARQSKQLGIDIKFLDEEFIYIQGNLVLRVHSVLDGMRCSNCEEFYQMAEPNQEDGTLICYSCRLNPYR